MKRLIEKTIIALLIISLCVNFIFPYHAYAYQVPNSSEKETMQTYIRSYMHKQVEQYINDYNNSLPAGASRVNSPEDLPESNLADLKDMLEEIKQAIPVDSIILSYNAELANKYSEYLQTSGDELYEDASQYIDNHSSTTPATSINDDEEYIGITLGGILDTVFGFLTYVFKLVFLVPGLVINLLLTDIASVGGSLQTVSFEDILFNRVPLVDVNIFSMTETASGAAVSETITEIRENVAGWYAAFRNLAIVVSFAMLIYIGIRMALDSFAEKRARYKQMLMHWAVGFGLIFVLHYFIVFILKANTWAVNIFANSQTSTGGDYMADLLAKAFDISLVHSWGAAIMYTILLFVTLSFLIIYIKRMLMTCFLVMVAPLITISYSADKIGNNRSEILNQWVKEFCYNVLIQPFHCITYMVFMGATMANLEANVRNLNFGAMIISIACMLCIFTGEKLIRQIFGFTKSKSVASKLFTGSMITSAINDIKTIRNAREERENEEEEEAEPEAPVLMPSGARTNEYMANVQLIDEKDPKGEQGSRNNNQENGNNQENNNNRNNNNNNNNNTPAVTPVKERTKLQKAVQKVQDHTPVILRDIGSEYVGAVKDVTGISRVEQNQQKGKSKIPSYQEQFLIASKDYAKQNGLTKKQLDMKIQAIRKTSFNDLKTNSDRIYKTWISKMDSDLAKNGSKNVAKDMRDFIEEKYEG